MPGEASAVEYPGLRELVNGVDNMGEGMMSRAREPGRLNLLCFVSLCCFGLRGMNDVYSAVMRTGAVEGEEGRREGKGKVEGAALGDFGG